MLAAIFKHYTPEKNFTAWNNNKIVTDEQIKGLLALTLFFNTLQINFTKCITSTNSTDGAAGDDTPN